MKIGIYSYATNDLNSDIISYQKQVFRSFNLDIQQVILDRLPPLNINDPYNYNAHADTLNNIIKTSSEDYIIFFDIDCIPLTYDFYDIICDDISKNILSGAVGYANHKDKNKLYVHPCFMGFSKTLYMECECPNFRQYVLGDVGQMFTDVCISQHKKLKYWNITDSKDKIWDVTPLQQQFGHGTVFENMIYHQFEIRKQEQHDSFINKCKYVLSNNS